MSDMKIDPTRAKALVSALQSVSERVAKAGGGGRSVSFHFSTPTFHVTLSQMIIFTCALTREGLG